MANNDNNKQGLPGVIFASAVGICIIAIMAAVTWRVVRWIGGF